MSTVGVRDESMFEREQRADTEALRMMLADASGRRVLGLLLDRMGLLRRLPPEGADAIQAMCVGFYNQLCEVDGEKTVQLVSDLLSRRHAIRREGMMKEHCKQKDYDESISI